MTKIWNLSRREFVKAGALASGGLVLGVHLPERNAWARETVGSFEPNAFIRIDTDGSVTIWVAKSEMGQGVHTSLPMIVAEELEADWTTVRIEQADAHPRKYGSQMTAGSSSVRRSWNLLRKTGAAGREMLIAAAAEMWSVEPGSCRAYNGQVIHSPTGRQLPYGELVSHAAGLPVPENPALKDPKDFRLLGKPMRRTDTPAKVDGTAVFGIDVRVPGMLFATVVRCPVFGGSVKSFDAQKAKTVDGVRDVVQIESGVAVVAENTWAAIKGARSLDIEWAPGSLAGTSSADISKRFEELCAQEGAVARDEGDVMTALSQAATRVDAVYEVPYLAHATMEPMNCTADVRRDRCEIWAPTQNPQRSMGTARRITGLPPEAITVHVTMLGGGFGRRSEQDFIADAVETSMKAGAPVQVVWTREEDMQHDFYRPATYNRFSAALDGKGRVTAWTHRIAGPSILSRFGRNLRNGIDRTSLSGAANLPYEVPNIHVDYCKADIEVPVGFWRSVGSSQNAFVTESFVDELAHAVGADPFEFRRNLLSHHARHKGVLELAAERAGWGRPLPQGHGSGIAVAESYGSFVAQVAEVSVDDKGKVRVHRVVCAVDCGQYVNPDTIEAQMESGIVYGLTAALYGEIAIENGRVKQSNFHDYQMLRMPEMPKIEVHIVRSTEGPGGIGEPGTPPIAPAVANAVFAATGRRVRQLPIRAGQLIGD